LSKTTANVKNIKPWFIPVRKSDIRIKKNLLRIFSKLELLKQKQNKAEKAYQMCAYQMCSIKIVKLKNIASTLSTKPLLFFSD